MPNAIRNRRLIYPVRGELVDPDVLAFKAVLDANSESYWDSEITMLDNFVKACKAGSGLWDEIITLWVPIGSWGDNVFRALKHPSGTGTLMTNNLFVSGDWTRTSGLDGTAGGRSIDTLTSESDYTPSDDTHMMVVSETSGVTGSHRDLGVLPSDRFQLIISFSNGAFYRSFTSGSAIENQSNTTTDGVFIATRKSGTATYWRDTTVIQSVAATNSPDTAGAGNIHIYRANLQNSNKVLGAASVGEGITSGQQAAYETALQALRTERSNLTA